MSTSEQDFQENRTTGFAAGKRDYELGLVFGDNNADALAAMPDGFETGYRDGYEDAHAQATKDVEHDEDECNAYCAGRCVAEGEPKPNYSIFKVVSLFDGRPEIRTSYANQRGLAGRDIGLDARCAHRVAFSEGCTECRMSGGVLVIEGRYDLPPRA